MARKNYRGAQFNQSPTIVEKAGAVIEDVRNLIMKYDDSGNVVLATAGTDKPLGIALIEAGYNLKGYYYWNDSDSYEELDGYNLRFGLTWVDHETGRRRWKKSRHYFSKICKTHLVD